MMSATDIRQGEDAKLKGWHVLLIMLGFFGVMFAVNGVFLYSAITSFPGEYTEKSYAQGLDYNSKLEARRAQAELGWTVRAGLMEGERSGVAVEIVDEAGAGLAGLEVSAVLRRPVTDTADLVLSLTADSADGSYSAYLPELEKGRWELQIKAATPSGEAVVEAHKTITVS